MHTPYCFHCETREVEAPFTYSDGSGFCSAECEDAANNVESSYSYEAEEPFDRDWRDDEAALESVYGPTDDGSGWLDEGWYE